MSVTDPDPELAVFEDDPRGIDRLMLLSIIGVTFSCLESKTFIPTDIFYIRYLHKHQSEKVLFKQFFVSSHE